ncbi:hypothetical protein ACLM45_04595 [Synechococcus sp. A10-1-5-9]|uniref:hypothetical protein n=1 Tax=Synechococcus sp. A10-1-5-9 TaxID=3392295 RepID=UPI0039E85D23
MNELFGWIVFVVSTCLGGSFSNWVHVDDAAGAALAAINGCWTGLVNVVNDEPYGIEILWIAP